MTATANLRYQPTNNLFFNAIFSANVNNGSIETYYGENTFHSKLLRRADSDGTVSSDSYMPYGGEYTSQKTKTWDGRHDCRETTTNT